MAKVRGIFFNGNDYSDIHVLRGHAYELGEKVVLDMDDNTTKWGKDAITGVTIRYTSNFMGTVAGNTFSGNGVSIDTHTGKITALAAPSANPRRNFIVTITVTGANVSNGPHIRSVRFQIHQSIVHKWVTPGTLTVRRGMLDSDAARTGMRFSVFAQFDDGVVGDLSNYRQFNNASVANCIRWTPDSNFVNRPGEIHNGEILALPGNAAGSSVAVTATLPPLLGGGTATATLKFDHEWTQAHPNQVKCINSPPRVAYARRNDVPNVLFLCDGFSAAAGNDGAKLDSIVRNFVLKLRAQHLYKPLDILIDSMNIWTAYMDSQEDGISIRNELIFGSGVGTEDLKFPTQVVIFDTSTLVPAEMAGWTADELGKLIFLVGTPIPGQGLLGDIDAAVPVILTPAQIRADWKKTVRVKEGISNADNDLAIDSISDALISAWRDEAYRRLPNLKDTALGSYFGGIASIPQAKDADDSLFALDPTRIDRDKLDRFLSSLEAGPGNRMDGIWNLSADGTRGKDFDLVMILLNSSPAGRENNSEGYFFLQVAYPILDVLISAVPDPSNPQANKARRLIAGPVPAELDVVVPQSGETKTTVLIHELAHSFGLGDEYGETGVNSPSDLYFLFPKPDAGYFVEDLVNAANLQALSQLTDPGSSHIKGNSIKWRWNRISKAGIVDAPMTANGVENFGVPLKAGHGINFKENDVVFLRYRAPGIVTSPEFQVVSLNLDIITLRVAAGGTTSIEAMRVFVYGSELFSTVTTTKVSDIKGPVTKLADGNYTIVLQKDHKQYSVNESVKLRTIQPAVLNEMTLQSTTLKVVGTPVGDVVVVTKEKTTDTLSLDDLLNFTRGSVLYKPVPAFASVQSDTYRFSELVSKNVLDAINRDKIPLTGAVCKVHNGSTQIMSSEIGSIAFPKSTCSCASLNRNEIVGLYSGGSFFHCGIYHPTGHCMMKAVSHDAEFCVVCKYVLTEMIDPTKHGDVDAQISAIYPLIR